MKVKVWKRNVNTRTVSEEHELRLGQYSEFYLPSVRHDEELWVRIEGPDGMETTLRLKR